MISLRAFSALFLTVTCSTLFAQTKDSLADEPKEKSSFDFFRRLGGAFQVEKANVEPLGKSGRITETQLTTMPKLNVGDTWTYGLHDKYSRERSSFTVTALDVDANRIVYDLGEKNEYAAGLRWEVIFRDGALYSDFLRFPLTHGKTWKVNFTTKDSSGLDWLYEDYYEVLGEERLKVPAGTFDTIVVQRIRQQQPVRVPHGFAPLSRWNITTTQWYAPAAKRYIKETEFRKSGHSDQRGETTEELTQFKLMP